MLDDRITALARKTSIIQLKDLDHPLALRIGGLKAKMHGNGRMYIYITQAYEQELFQRGAVVWRNLLRAHNSLGAARTETLRQDLFESFRSQFDEIVRDLAPIFNKDMQGCPPRADLLASFGNARDRELARHDAEIDHYVASLEIAAARGSVTSGEYNFYGNVGAVLTGPGSVAHVTQHIGADQREALLAALRDVKQALVQAADVPPRDQQDLVELADEAIGEVAKESPNTRRLSMILQSLASAVQGIASGPAAYEVLLAAAATIGVPL